MTEVRSRWMKAQLSELKETLKIMKLSALPLMSSAHVCSVLSHVRLFATAWTIAAPSPPQSPLSMGFPKQAYWSGLPFLSPGELIHPEIKLRLWRLLHWQADSLPMSNLGSSSSVAVASVCEVLGTELGTSKISAVSTVVTAQGHTLSSWQVQEQNL